MRRREEVGVCGLESNPWKELGELWSGRALGEPGSSRALPGPAFPAGKGEGRVLVAAVSQNVSGRRAA